MWHRLPLHSGRQSPLWTASQGRSSSSPSGGGLLHELCAPGAHICGGSSTLSAGNKTERQPPVSLSYLTANLWLCDRAAVAAEPPQPATPKAGGQVPTSPAITTGRTEWDFTGLDLRLWMQWQQQWVFVLAAMALKPLGSHCTRGCWNSPGALPILLLSGRPESPSQKRCQEEAEAVTQSSLWARWSVSKQALADHLIWH